MHVCQNNKYFQYAILIYIVCQMNLDKTPIPFDMPGTSTTTYMVTRGMIPPTDCSLKRAIGGIHALCATKLLCTPNGINSNFLCYRTATLICLIGNTKLNSKTLTALDFQGKSDVLPFVLLLIYYRNLLKKFFKEVKLL